jgi:S-adenosylmethionine:tRNA ribosyltransferase-isomerase
VRGPTARTWRSGSARPTRALACRDPGAATGGHRPSTDPPRRAPTGPCPDAARWAHGDRRRERALSPRLVELSFDLEGEDLWAAIYAAGRPVQYAYLTEDLALWSVQTVFAARPWAAEMPSAGRPFTWEILLALRRRGVGVVALTHAAGLSSTGDPAIDAALPLPERYDIPAATVAAIERTRAAGGRVIAVGTTVVRALEGNAATHGRLQAGPGETDLVLGPGQALRVVDGIVTGMHEATEPLPAPDRLPRRAELRAAVATPALGYRGHELGDATLVY